MMKLIYTFLISSMCITTHTASSERSTVTVSICETDNEQILSLADQAMEALTKTDALIGQMQRRKKHSAPELPALQKSCDELTESLINLVVLRNKSVDEAHRRITRSLSSLEEWCPKKTN